MMLTTLPIFNFIPVLDRFVCRSVSKEWYARIPFPEVRNTELEKIMRETGILSLKIFLLISGHQKPSEFLILTTFLQKGGILTSANFSKAAVQKGFQILSSILVEPIAPTQDNFQAVVDNSNYYQLKNGISILQRLKILSEKNFLLLARNTDSWNLGECYKILHAAKLLDDELEDRVATHPNPQMLKRTFEVLEDNEMLTKENVIEALVYPNLDKLICIIPQQNTLTLPKWKSDVWYVELISEILKTEGISLPQIKKIIEEHSAPELLYKALLKLLTNTKEDIAIEVQILRECMRSIICVRLLDLNFLTPENEALVKEHKNIEGLYEALNLFFIQKIREPDFVSIATHDDPVKKAREILTGWLPYYTK